MKREIILTILSLVAGFLAGILNQRYIYYMKTGKHLQNVKRKTK